MNNDLFVTTLTIEAGEEQGKTIHLGQETIVIGRGQEDTNNISFVNPFISRQHAEIYYSNRVFFLKVLLEQDNCLKKVEVDALLL